MTASTSIIIFGASGDLTRRKLIPGLYNLFTKGRLPDTFQIIGSARSAMSHEEFRQFGCDGTAQFAADVFDAEQWDIFAQRLFYVTGDITQPAAFTQLNGFLKKEEQGAANRLYYLSTAPRFFLTAVQQLHAAGMVEEEETGPWRRVIIEKPFGTDLASAKSLNYELHKLLQERQIYRIDHYLAKETVQNLLVFRFANAIFEPIWNRNYIDNIQITATETVDVGHRAGYYDRAGVLRDMFQNHLLQLTSLVAMEPPDSFDADAVRNEKAKVLRAIRPVDKASLAKTTVRAQYDGYANADGVADQSTTPTYAAVKLFVDNWRWQGVPFYLRSGKALNKKVTEIIIQFKSPPHLMFPMPADAEIKANDLAICIQPHEGIHLEIEAKVPGTDADMRTVALGFHYADSFEGIPIPEAYERLLLEALEGDATLFTRSDSIEAAWKYIDGVLQGFESDAAPPVTSYAPGTWGPDAADELLGQTGREWRHGCAEH